MTPPQAHPVDEVRLADASMATVLRLAQAKQWMMHPDTFRAMGTPGTKEHLTALNVSEWAQDYSINVALSPVVPVGFVIPQGDVSPLMVPPRSAGADEATRAAVHDAGQVPVVSRGLQVWVGIAVLIVLAVIVFLLTR